MNRTYGTIMKDANGNLYLIREEEMFPVGSGSVDFYRLREGDHVEFRAKEGEMYPAILRVLGNIYAK